jgi:tetratricopeptide (TPR) repeat protein
MAAARQKADECLNIRNDLVGTLSYLPEMRAELAESHDLVGDLLRAEKKFDGAREAFLRARKLRSSLVRERTSHPDRQKWLLGLSMSHVRLGDTDTDEDVAQNPGKPAEATRPLIESASKHYDASLAYSAQLYLSDPTSQAWRRELSWSFNKDGDVKAHLRRWEPAVASYENALCLRRALHEEDSGNTRWASDVSWTLQKLASARLGKGDVDEADVNLFEMIFIRQQLVTRDKRGDQVLTQELIVGFMQLAEYERQIDQPESVLAILRTISRLSERLKGADGLIPARLRVPDTSKLSDWVDGRLSQSQAKQVDKHWEEILNVQIFQKASGLANRVYRPDCLGKLNATLKALSPPT